VRWLGQLVDKDAIELLTRRLHDDDDGVRAAAASALARIGVGDLAAFAATALADRALGVRLAGVELLVAAHRDDLLARLGDDADPMIATRAGIARRRTEPLAAGRAIARALAAPEWTIRAGAANLLASAVAADVADQLARALLKDPVLAVRLAAARVLAHGGDKATALEQFARALGATTGEELQAATDLAALGDPRGAAALGQFLHDPARTADQRAAAAAAHRGGRQITPQLVAALADPSGQVRVEAAAALGALAR
jgi:HEAT repeat protein